MTVDVNYSQARTGLERNPDSITVLAGAEQPIPYGLRVAAKRNLTDLAALLGLDGLDEVLAALDLEEVAL